MTEKKYDVFISYRRVTGLETALWLRTCLRESGYKVFFDHREIHEGLFDEQILQAIESATDFILLLTENSLDRCVNENDWIRKEIHHAIVHKKNIIPFRIPGFKFPDGIPQEIKNLDKLQAVIRSTEYPEAPVAKLKGMLHAIPGSVSSTPKSTEELQKRLQMLLQREYWSAAEKLFTEFQFEDPAWELLGIQLKYHCPTKDELVSIADPLEQVFENVLVAADETLIVQLFDLIDRQKQKQKGADKAPVVIPVSPVSAPPEQQRKGNDLSSADWFKKGHQYEKKREYGKALKWYRSAAEQGNADAQNCLGRMYEYGHGVKRDYSETCKWYRLAAEQGNLDAQNNLGYMYYNGRGVPQDFTEACKWYRLAAGQGDVNAQNTLGNMYANGWGVAQDYTEAGKWYRLAAEQGRSYAQNELGSMYYNGLGVEQDYSEAAKWYRLAADRGDEAGQCNLGHMYYNGLGVTQDYAEAVKWYRLAADKENAYAQCMLGTMYYRGLGTAQNYAEAVRRYRSAADQGNAYAQSKLGFMYYSGQGTAQDYAESVKWYRSAADQGEAVAQYGLGYMYYNGNGVAQDYAEACKWYHLAADQGYAEAQYMLGIMYQNGCGVKQSKESAFKWFQTAANQGYAAALEALRALQS